MKEETKKVRDILKDIGISYRDVSLMYSDDRVLIVAKRNKDYIARQLITNEEKLKENRMFFQIHGDSIIGVSNAKRITGVMVDEVAG